MTDVRAGPLRRCLATFSRSACRRFLYAALGAILVFSLMTAVLPVRKAQAQSICGAQCALILLPLHAGVFQTAFIRVGHVALRAGITAAMEEHKQQFMVELFFYDWIMSGMQAIANQLTAAAMGQMFMIGSFLDAQEQLSRQTMFQELTARAYKDYHPSVQMCAIGSAARGLASAARSSEEVASVLSRRAIDRQLHSRSIAGAPGANREIKSRIEQFKSRYCDPNDNNREPGKALTGLTVLCGTTGPAGGWSINRDVDASRLFGAAPFRARYSNGGDNDLDDPDLLALSANLYGSDVIRPVPEKILESTSDVRETGNQEILLDIRSIAAKRSVAQDSFSQIAGMRAMSDDAGGASAPFMSALMQAMGYSAKDAMTAVDAYPSYNARMELLGKKIYMDPDFYTNLYDKPANVARVGAAIRAIGLIQDMDAYKSRLRTEMSLSVLLELMIENEQTIVNGRLSEARPAGGKKQ